MDRMQRGWELRWLSGFAYTPIKRPPISRVIILSVVIVITVCSYSEDNGTCIFRKPLFQRNTLPEFPEK